MDDSGFYSLYSKPSEAEKDTSLFGAYDGSLHHRNPADDLQESFLIGHQIGIENKDYVIRQKSNNDLGFFILFFDLIVVIILLGLYRKQFFLSIQSLFSYKYYQRIESKTSLLKHPLTIALFGVFIVNISLMIELTMSRLSISWPFLSVDYGIIYLMGLIFLFYLLKTIVVYMSAQIFDAPNMGRIYTDYLFLSLGSIGIFLCIFLWLDIYMDSSIISHILWSIIGLLSFVRILRSYSIILLKSAFSPFHFFMYLCTVEILPLIVLGKLVMKGI
ncbi:MAG: hypothetical protein DRI84_01760 [Bacteroidetes bacterium]|nr:MAG: hypothetical protein DRI84_01760 [Bacteroidota bacterium]